MNIPLIFAQFWVPPWVKNYYLRKLFTITAEAFDTVPPSVKGVHYDVLLRRFAHFTAIMTVHHLHNDADSEEPLKRLYDDACKLGKSLRKKYYVANKDDAIRLFRIVYAAIGIDAEQGGDGELRVQRCFFSRHYTTDTCKMMSALDRGVFAGITGGGDMKFTNRITEDGSHCIIRYSLKGTS